MQRWWGTLTRRKKADPDKTRRLERELFPELHTKLVLRADGSTLRYVPNGDGWTVVHIGARPQRAGMANMKSSGGDIIEKNRALMMSDEWELGHYDADRNLIATVEHDNGVFREPLSLKEGETLWALIPGEGVGQVARGPLHFNKVERR